MRVFLFILFDFIIISGHAQHTAGMDGNIKNNAYAQFQAGQYERVMFLLESKQQRLTTPEEYLYLISRLKTGNREVGDLEQFSAEHSTHPLNALANYSLAGHHFHCGDSMKSKQFLSKTLPGRLSEKDRGGFHFMSGYLAVQDKQYDLASKHFLAAQKPPVNNRSEVLYYQGFTYYNLNQKKESAEAFEQVKDHVKFGGSAKFFLAKMWLDEGRYEQVIALSKSELTEEKTLSNSAFYQLIGEAYAKQDEVNKATAYFDRALSLHPNKPSPALYYQAGVARFKQGNEKKAIEHFVQAGIGADEYAHLSAFQLGRLYVKATAYDQALTAFTEASASEDPTIREEALFHVGKLNAHLGNYTSAADYLIDYTGTFPKGKWDVEAQNLLAQCYLRSSNYDQAVSQLEKLGNTTNQQQSIYQKVAFQKAQLAYNDGNYPTAIEWFEKSLKYPLNPELANETHFYIGEAFLQLGDYGSAIISFKKQKHPLYNTFYSLGYAYYNQQDYGQARQYFSQYLNGNLISKWMEDAKLRLADCLYALKDYPAAIKTYKEYNSKNTSDYATYQIGVVAKNQGNSQAARLSFEKVLGFDHSELLDDASFQLAMLRFEDAAFEEAGFLFGSFIAKYPLSTYSPDAYVNRAVCRTNLDRLSDARKDYEYVLEHFIQKNQAFNAILGLQELKQKGVPINNIDRTIAKYKAANPEGSSLEVVEFESAKGRYFDLDYAGAIIVLERFLAEYPESAYQAEATFYLADALYRDQQLKKAKKHFESLRKSKDKRMGRILRRLGNINTQLQDYDKAIGAYEELKDLNLTAKDNYNAMAGLLEVHYLIQNYQQAVRIAGQIIMADWKPFNAEKAAGLVQGNAFLALTDTTKALETYRKLAIDNNAISAEASYKMGLIMHFKKEYQRSLDHLFDHNSKYGSYTEWIDKSYLLIAENYIAMNELFHAKATLRSIIQHSQNKGIVDEANIRLKKIEQSTPGTGNQHN